MFQFAFFSVGVGELVLLAVTAVIAGLAAWRLAAARWWCACAVGSLAVAAILTPADPVSTLIGGVLLCAAAAIGAMTTRRVTTA